MSVTVPAIRGRFGETEYFEATMKARDFAQAIRPPLEADDWASFSIEERLQRVPNDKRIMSQIAPYVANNQDRFFGSMIVLMYKAEVEFEPLGSFKAALPGAYRQSASQMGFLTISGGELIVLDGQHRYLALRLVLQGAVEGKAARTLSDDDVSVLFVQHESSIKTRRIFNVVNRNAKPTSRADNIITSEDDGYAIVARRLLSDDQPLGRARGRGREELVEWKNNTLGQRSIQLTTLSAVYDTVKLILEHGRVGPLSLSDRPSDEDLESWIEMCAAVWLTLLSDLSAYKTAIERPQDIPALRRDDARTSLLFKPAAQVALIDGLLRAQATSGLPFVEIVRRANKVADWSMTSPFWSGVIVKTTGAIDAGPESRRRMALLLTYLLAGDAMSAEDKYDTWLAFNEAKGRRPTAWITSGFKADDDLEDLPEPIAGEAYRVSDARAWIQPGAERSGSHRQQLAP